MNRSFGVGTGAVLLLGMMFRSGSAPAPAPQLSAAPSATPAPPSAPSEPGRAAFARAGKKSTGEGPWMASCRYWETSTGIQYPGKEDKDAKVSLELEAGGGKIESKLKASESESNSECERNGDAWGIPVPPAPAKGRAPAGFIPLVKPDITAIVAAVPDPIHTHLALQFDRDIDAILQAAAENGYLPSQYWLPWKLPQEDLATGALSAAASDDAEQTRREQQPGLIVLKYASETSSSQSYDWRSYDRVMYLFIVGESPASGMNGAQLRNALRYEAMLRTGYPTARISLSTRGTGDLALIGSPNSDSAVSLREAIEAAKNDLAKKDLKVSSVHIAGSTETEQANDALQVAFGDSTIPVRYVSFGEDFEYEKHETLNLLSNSGYATDRVAFLVEDGTVFGDEGGAAIKGFSSGTGGKGLPPLIVRFPREISLLRNAQAKITTSSAPSPYLQLTLKDSSANDTVPHFSSEQTPLSQEAALMSIQRELVAYHAQFLAIQATNMLDKIYLANYFHRACPNIRLVFLGGGDLLLEREVDNVPYIGSVTMTPYNLVGLLRLPRSQTVSRAFPDSASESMFNAASYTFESPWALEIGTNPMLAGYETTRDANAGKPFDQPPIHASLWATVIGSDGYYPLGVAASCASDSLQSLPDFAAGQPQPCVVKDRYAAASLGKPSASDEMRQFARSAPLFPSLMWTVLSIVLGLYCAGHGAVLFAAHFWSPFTRDLAIRSNDQPMRRSVYVNIGAVMLFSMVFVLEWPVFCTGPVLKLNPASTNIARAVFASGLFVVLATLSSTWRHSFQKSATGGLSAFNTWQTTCSFFNAVAGLALFVIPAVWARLCSLDAFGELRTGYGVFFSFRCLHPDSQVSPVVPVLLVLLGWYLWAVCQTCRLRFSKESRPKLPGRIVCSAPLPLYVADEDLDDCKTRTDPRLYENLTCLLITRDLLARFVPRVKPFLGFALAIAYVAAFLFLMSIRSIESVDRMVLDRQQHPTLYEALIVGLTLPLLTISIAGWVRLMLVWDSLRRGLLERLEMYPLRDAFTRLKGFGWFAMMRDTGLHLRWKEMARANESIRQLNNNSEVVQAVWDFSPAARFELRSRYQRLEEDIKDVYGLVKGKQPDDPSRYPRLRVAGGDQDLPGDNDIAGLELIAAIESDYAAVCEILLHSVLIPYWLMKRSGFVEGDTGPSGDPEYIRLAEELVALRYLSLIRAVLGNLRYLMTFVSTAFVLSLIAWNSYPFQPRELVDWAFTFTFIILFGFMILVFVQMHRNALLSRITDTKPNELGFAFYWRLVTFGAIPLLTWLSYQFPQAWSGIFRLVQPGLSAMK